MIPLKNTTSVFLLAVVCFALLPGARAVSPAPDGGYPGFNTAEGDQALFLLFGGFGNTGLGWRSGFSAVGANFNTGVGAGTLVLNNGDSNTAVGTVALLLNTTGTNNTAVGTDALVNNDAGSHSTAVGDSALSNSNGDFNTALGARAGTVSGIMSNNIFIGDLGFPGDENVISIGALATSGTNYTETFIGGIFGGSVDSATAVPVYVDKFAHLGTILVNASERKLRTRCPQGVPFQAKLNEFQKQQRRIAELESTVARLAATVKEQAAQIQKVSAQIELNKSAPQTVLNNR